MGLRTRKKKPPMCKAVFLGISTFYVVTITCSHILSVPWLITSVVTEKMLKEVLGSLHHSKGLGYSASCVVLLPSRFSGKYFNTV